jgi:hypothetical protein
MIYGRGVYVPSLVGREANLAAAIIASGFRGKHLFEDFGYYSFSFSELGSLAMHKLVLLTHEPE